ncbi:MAG: D-tyrosyl-tRNA(Tyr) deacylase [Clostridia bacterium]|nr:D-tyrosyl-tRNA(Tyr) deacylase [Clostridia bacterium]
MTAVIQRVAHASVVADGEPSGSCGAGLMILLGVIQGDTEEDAIRLAEKIAKMRIFSDDNGRMNLSVIDIGGEALVVSNFTLAANYRKGNRPDYFNAASPDEAERLYSFFVDRLRESVRSVQTGVFGADMKIEISAEGPVTIVMDSNQLKKEGKV